MQYLYRDRDTAFKVTFKRAFNRRGLGVLFIL